MKSLHRNYSPPTPTEPVKTDYQQLERETLEAALRHASRQDGVERVLSVRREPAVGAGENYLSEIERLEARLVLSSGRTVTRSFVLKRAIQGPADNPLLSYKKVVFWKEIMVYQIILQSLEELMEELDESMEKIWCDVYHIDKKGMILMQDLKTEGYRMGDRRQGLSLEDSRLALWTLGKYHGLTKTLEDRLCPPTGLFPPPNVAGNPIHCEYFFVKALRNLCKTIEADWGPDWKDVLAKLNKPTEELVKNGTQVLKQETKVNTFLHGDFWTNNIMFRYDPTGYPIGVRLIDFQLSFKGSVAYDVLYFLHTSVPGELRRTRERELVEVYHKGLQDTLKSFGYAPGGIPALEDVLHDLEKLRFWRVMVTIFFHPFITCDGEQNLNVDDILRSKGEKGHFPHIFKRPGWKEEIGPDLKRFCELGIL